MIRCNLVLAGLISVANTYAGDGSVFSPDPITLEVPKLDQSAGIKGMTIALKALGDLKESQNSDGSWGDSLNQIKSTALVFLALKRLAPPGRYEEAIAKAQAWLLLSNPKTDEDKLAVILAISGAYTSSRSPRISDKGVHREHKEKVNALLNSIKSGKDNPWFDLLAMSALPLNVERPVWSAFDDALRKKYRDGKTKLDPDNIDGYLEMYLTACVKRWSKEGSWQEYQASLVELATERQEKIGSFPVSEEAATPAATALQSLCFSLENVAAGRHFEIMTKEDKAAKKHGTEDESPK